MSVSTFTWLAHDAEQARRSAELVRALEEPETVDSLGLGTVRDGFAGIFFPGTSTIQTRARYAVLVPWSMQLVAERRPRDKAQYDRFLREIEAKTIQSLLRGSPQGELGIIGRNRGAETKRLASSVYWGALAEWGVKVAPELTMSAYRDWALKRRSKERVGDESGDATVYRVWDELPERPENFPDEPLSILPSAEESSYLLERMAATSAGGLHAGFSQALGPSLLGAVAQSPECRHLGHPWQIAGEVELSTYVRDCLRHAEAFSLVMQGARLRYIQLLFDAQRRASLPVSEGRDQLDRLVAEWDAEMLERSDLVSTWSTQLPEMYLSLERAGVAVGAPTRDFVRSWASAAVADPGEAMTSKGTDALVRDREVALKSPNARLANESSLRAWDGEIFGGDRLDFRWHIARVMVDDCVRGLEVDDAVS